tara:strand:- start:270 stop:437 length:168 start_codon:yes stop_codon:yes gene_type:complete
MTCGADAQQVIHGMPTYDDYASGKYYIAGCVLDDDSSEAEWYCPECDMFIDVETN